MKLPRDVSADRLIRALARLARLPLAEVCAGVVEKLADCDEAEPATPSARKLTERHRDWQAQATRLSSQKLESKMLVKALGSFVLGINQHGEDAHFGASYSKQRIGQEHRTKTLALIGASHGKPSQ